MTERLAPGRLAHSCLTCRRRHKKCDLRQPTCARCEKGSFHCLGYDNNQRKAAPLERPTPRPILPKPQRQQTTNVTTNQVAVKLHPGNYEGTEEPPVAGSSLVTLNAPGSYSSEFSLTSEAHHGSRITTQYRNGQVFTTTNEFSTVAGSSPSLQQLFSFFTRMSLSPSDPTLTYLSSPQLDGYVMGHCTQMVKRLYFRPTGSQQNQLFNTVITRLTTSRLSRWVKLLTSKVVEALVMVDTSKRQFYSHWLGDVEAGVRTMLVRGPTSREARELQGDWLEIAVLKTVLVHTSNAYQVLRSAVPTFLQAVYSCPEFWSTHSDPTTIPLRNILISDRIELTSFTLVDCTLAMAFGLPQQIEYDTSGSPLPDLFLPHEWSHNSPVEFQLLLTDINACRDDRPGALEWREIERRLLTWQPQPTRQTNAWESWMVVAWLAVQESWRLTLLAYLYMAVCGSSSDDLRIQRCVTQILQVVSTVKVHDSTRVNVPFFIQYLIAGICARSEKHRAVVRGKLLDRYETRFWKMRGADFVPVLDYLWHEIGSGSRSITWSDYVRSRETMLPVVM